MVNGSVHEPVPALEPFGRVTIVGAGVIGISWIGLLCAHGVRVTVTDPRTDLEAVVREGITEIEPGLRELGLPTSGLTDGLRFHQDLAEAVREADVVQENGPERLEVKQQMWRTIEESAPSHALFATSTSGIRATDIAQALRQPERLVVGHPFNPPHLVPLVEIVPGERTSAETIERARAFYTALGKRPQVLRKEIPGFVANRLQSALFRECVYLVQQGVVTEQELDDIVTASIGLRWAVAGPFRTFHLGGGPGGLPHFLATLGRSMATQRWPQLGAPELDDVTVELLSAQAEDFPGSVSELAARRDSGQIAVMEALGELPGKD